MKTYLLMPNFTTHRDGTVQLGNLIADPFRPSKPLSLPSAPVETSIHEDTAFGLSYSATRSHEAGAWAQWLQIASAKLDGAISASNLEDYTADALETLTMKQDPTDEQATKLSREPRVFSAMKGAFGGRPVFMITGIKVAKGFRRTNQISGTKQGEVNGEVPVVEGLSLGGTFATSHSNSRIESATSTSDIVFAYQLHVIARKGWVHKTISADVYVPKAALLERSEPGITNEHFDAFPASVDTLMEVAKENEDTLVIREIMEMDERGVCVALE
jgi:hypothetical protein